MPIVMLAQWSSLNDILMIKLIFSFATFPLLFVIAFCWGEDIGSSGQWFPAAENAKVKAGKQTFISGKGFYVQLILSLSLSLSLLLPVKKVCLCWCCKKVLQWPSRKRIEKNFDVKLKVSFPPNLYFFYFCQTGRTASTTTATTTTASTTTASTTISR